MNSNDLIPRAAALDAISTDGGCGMCARRVLDIPAVDAAPVVHGRWDEIRDYSQAGLISFECLECGRLCDTLYKYCPHCGAKMDEEDRHEDQEADAE